MEEFERRYWDELTGTTLGERYRGLLERWISLESAYRWQAGDVYFPAGRRVRQVTHWVQNYRLGGPGITSIPNTDVFGKQWWVWWIKAQPDWRIVDGDPIRADAEGRPWGSMVCPGKNGILSVVASLYWWGSALKRLGKVSQSWLNAVEDVAWVMEQLKKVAE
ncbi:hypothetical protein C8F01DRAFT_1000131 [Mycena amicta]|nr:hypothetical protein C8F01DRAFT_1000131 [Mycena amicta]